ncbi:NAD(P)-binding domain-containing protein [Promicromonospora sp. NPDC050249]|uniref:NAD(P)-dependent oxidoreductase n=1 Tax=Promicromonospora sp. NPDC050249 TaxID=3154743 RepID=UPI0033D78C71
MTTLTVLGLGPMGHALTAALTAARHSTTVWNRTPGKGDDLAATIAGTAAEAIAASPLVVVCLRNYAVVREVLDADALKGRTLVNLSGGTPRQARELADWAHDHAVDYLDGVIVSMPETIGTPEAALYYSGPQDVYERYRPTLAAFGENAYYLGDDPGRAASLDASLQDLLWTSMSGAVHMFALARAEGIAPHDVAPHVKAMLGFFPAMIDLLAEQLSAGRYPGDLGSITASATVMDHVLEVVRANDLDNGVLSSARAEVQRAIDAGHGREGFARLAAMPG